MPGEPLAVTQSAFFHLHEDVLQLFQVIAHLKACLEEYPIDYASPRFVRWLENHRVDEWPADPYAAEIANRVCEALEQAISLTDLANSIFKRRKLFFAIPRKSWIQEFKAQQLRSLAHSQSHCAMTQLVHQVYVADFQKTKRAGVS